MCQSDDPSGKANSFRNHQPAKPCKNEADIGRFVFGELTAVLRPIALDPLSVLEQLSLCTTCVILRWSIGLTNPYL